MRVPILLLSFLVLSVGAATGLSAQRYGEWDVPCDLRLPPRFAYPFAGGIETAGVQFLTSWQSFVLTAPRPSLNWYHAIPDRHPISVDGDHRWDDAAVRVHCYVVRNPYGLIHHRDPVATGGVVRRLPSACQGGTDDFAPITSDAYDPYGDGEPGPGSDCESTGSEGAGESGASGTQYEPGDATGGETVDWATGRGNGGQSVCGDQAVVEYLCIDVWVDDVGWVVWSCGFATTC